MTTPASNRELFEELVARYADGRLDDNEVAALEQVLASDADAKQQFILYMDLHARLHWNNRAEADVSHEKPLAVGSKPFASEDPTEYKPRPKSLLNWASRNPKGPAIAIAATLLIAALVVMGLVPVKEWMAGGGKVKPEEREPGVNQDFVAKLTDWRDDVWLEDSRPPLDDPRLKIGRRLKIESGLIEVTYLTGARVVIEGPAEFVVGGTEAQRQKAQSKETARSSYPKSSLLNPKSSLANSGYLALGKLVARVEEENAKGFTIETPTVRVEDLGTEFGVDVLRNGETEVFVLSGDVEVIRDKSEGPSQRVRLAKDQGAIITARGDTIVERASADPQRVAAARILLSTMRFARGSGRIDATADQGEMTWVAYHDLGGEASPGNITTQQDLATTVDLLKFDDGTESGVQLRITDAKALDARTVDKDGSLVTRPPRPETPAGKLFGNTGIDLDDGFVTVQGNTATLALKGLSPNRLYDIALYCDRNEKPDGAELFVMRGPVGGTNSSSSGIVNTTTTEMETRPNDAGHIVRWTNIVPSSNGEISIKVSTKGRNIAYLSAIRLAEHKPANAKKSE